VTMLAPMSVHRGTCGPGKGNNRNSLSSQIQSKDATNMPHNININIIGNTFIFSLTMKMQELLWSQVRKPS